MAKNLRTELRAYQDIDSCRLAAIIWQLSEGATRDIAIQREALIDRWGELYPRHLEQDGDKSPKGRVRRANNRLAAANIIQRGDGIVIIAMPDLLEMSATNLTIIQDSGTREVPWVRWREMPQVPEHLRDTQKMIQQRSSPH